MININERVMHFQNSVGGCSAPMSYPVEIIVIVVCCLLGIIWAVYNIYKVEQINVRSRLVDNYNSYNQKSVINQHQENLLLEIGHKIS